MLKTKPAFRMVTVGGERFRVVPFRGKDGYVVRFTGPCSGCTDSWEDNGGTVEEKGSGCSECGYTGKRRQEEWIPLEMPGRQRKAPKKRRIAARAPPRVPSALANENRSILTVKIDHRTTGTEKR